MSLVLNLSGHRYVPLRKGEMSNLNWKLNIRVHHPEVEDLYRGHGTFYSGDAGLDLFAPEAVVVPAGARGFILDLGISTEMIELSTELENSRNISYYLYPRSSMAIRTPLRLANSVGIIDAGYRGRLGAIVDNLSDQDYTVSPGDRLVQICLPNLHPFSFELVSTLSSSDRDVKGMGSTSAATSAVSP